MTRNWQRLEEGLKREKLFSSRWPWRSTMESGWLPKGQVLVKGSGGNFGCSVECIISFFPISGVSRPQSRTWSLYQPGRSSPPIGKTKCWSRFFQSWKENQGTCVGPWWILPHLSPSMWEGSCAEWTWKDTCQPQATTRLSWRFVLKGEYFSHFSRSWVFNKAGFWDPNEKFIKMKTIWDTNFIVEFFVSWEGIFSY